MYGLVSFASRKGIRGAPESEPAGQTIRARTGVRGETFAYWYLRRNGYVMIARNFTSPGMKGEIDMIGFDGPVLAFVEVKTRCSDDDATAAKPEDAVNDAKRRNISRIARRFLINTQLSKALFRFDVIAIESPSGRRPIVRLHKNAFTMR